MDDETFRLELVAAANRLAPEVTEADRRAAAAASAQDAAIGRINEITSAARSSWFSYLLVLGFAFLSLIGVQDSDLFSASATTTLPIINYDVNLILFMWLAPLLLLLNFGYIHAYAEQNWGDLATVEARKDNLPVAAHIKSWLVVEFALYLRRYRRRAIENPPCVTPSSMGWVGGTVMSLLFWLAGPVVLLAFWIRSMTMHSPWITTLSGIIFWVSFVISLRSIWVLWSVMGEQNAG